MFAVDPRNPSAVRVVGQLLQAGAKRRWEASGASGVDPSDADHIE
jgi:hypothetical protein